MRWHCASHASYAAATAKKTAIIHPCCLLYVEAIVAPPYFVTWLPALGCKDGPIDWYPDDKVNGNLSNLVPFLFAPVCTC